MKDQQIEDRIATAIIIFTIIGVGTVLGAFCAGIYFLASWLINLF